ncbi:MAG: DoxX family protein [Balneolales bacterium]
MFKQLVDTDSSKTTLIIRLMVGAVFLSEGIQKYLFPEARGSGRFESIGLPMFDFLGYFVGGFEIVCGLLILLGWYTRIAAIPLIIIMLTAIATTKIPTGLEDGFWEMAHAARTDYAMLLGSIFLLIKGGGKWSFDKSSENPKSRS